MVAVCWTNLRLTYVLTVNLYFRELFWAGHLVRLKRQRRKRWRSFRETVGLRLAASLFVLDEGCCRICFQWEVKETANPPHLRSPRHLRSGWQQWKSAAINASEAGRQVGRDKSLQRSWKFKSNPPTNSTRERHRIRYVLSCYQLSYSLWSLRTILGASWQEPLRGICSVGLLFHMALRHETKSSDLSSPSFCSEQCAELHADSIRQKDPKFKKSFSDDSGYGLGLSFGPIHFRRVHWCPLWMFEACFGFPYVLVHNQMHTAKHQWTSWLIQGQVTLMQDR